MEDKVVEWHEVERDEEEGGGQGGRRDCRRGEEERKTKGDTGGGDKEQDSGCKQGEVGRRRTPVKNQTDEGEEGSMAGRGGEEMKEENRNLDGW